MNERDDDDWLYALSGRERRPGAGPATELEGRLLRAALRRSAAEVDARWETPAAAPAESPPSASPSRRRWRLTGPRRWSLPALAAGLAVLVFLVLPLPWRSTPPETGLRGGPDAPADGAQRVPAADPRAERDRWAELLLRSGAVIETYERFGRYGLRAAWPAAVPAAAAEQLRALGVTAITGQALLLEFEAGGR